MPPAHLPVFYPITSWLITLHVKIPIHLFKTATWLRPLSLTHHEVLAPPYPLSTDHAMESEPELWSRKQPTLSFPHSRPSFQLCSQAPVHFLSPASTRAAHCPVPFSLSLAFGHTKHSPEACSPFLAFGVPALMGFLPTSLTACHSSSYWLPPTQSIKFKCLRVLRWVPTFPLAMHSPESASSTVARVLSPA